MQIENVLGTQAATYLNRSGNKLPPTQIETGQEVHNKSFIRELAESFDPKNMSWQESMDLASALMKAGEGRLSAVFLPPPNLKVNSDGSVTNMAGTPEGDARMSAKFNMFDSLSGRIAFSKSRNEPTQILDEALAFLNKIQSAKDTAEINVYT